MTPLALDWKLDIKTVVGWIVGLGLFIWGASAAWTSVNGRLAGQDREIEILQGRLDELEGGMDVKNGFMILGKSKEYTKGAIEAMEAERKMREAEEPEP